ncbi:MAG TPA: serine/threonine-protein kinase [Acidobacteriota bacterium]|nr:serine/threonine-protein kinase [Acidobacteriota bacterium]
MPKNNKKIGKYEILDTIGKGAMGVVYKALDPDINRVVAIKAIRFDVISEESDREEIMKRFIREAQSAGKLIHPNIVTIYDVVRSENMTYIVMQYIEGYSLQKTISSGEKIPTEKAVRLMTQICDALGYAHQKGIIHRDIKPANILIDKEENPYLVDFGIARVETSTITQTGRTVGTPSYMSPEQVMGEKVDKCSDIFSLGVLLYEILIGKRPFHGDSITTVIYKIINEEPFSSTEIKKSLPKGFEPIISKALSKDPKKRYQTCDQLKNDLEENLKISSQKISEKPKILWIQISAAVAAFFVLATASVLLLKGKIHLPFMTSEKSIEITVESPLPPAKLIKGLINLPRELENQVKMSFENKNYLKKAQDKIQNKSKENEISKYLKSGINHYKEKRYENCIDDMKNILKLDKENQEAKNYIYLADTALSQIEIKNILEKQRKAEETKDLDSVITDIGSENILEQRKADLNLLFNHYRDIKSVYSDVKVNFNNTREAKVEFSHMLIAVYEKTNQRKVLFDGIKTWRMKKIGNNWKIVDN